MTRDLDEVLSHSEDPYCRSALLADKAMVLRHRGNHERLPTPRDTFLDSSVRCAEAAVRETHSPRPCFSSDYALVSAVGLRRIWSAGSRWPARPKAT